jgi:hypothetical protein
MNNEKKYRVLLYRSEVFLVILGSLLAAGTVGLLLLQGVLPIPAGIQYILLTAWIAAAFLAAPRLATMPAEIRIRGGKIAIRGKKGAEQTVAADDVLSYAYYKELLLYSLKINCRDKETISVINFKWNDDTDFRSFRAALEGLLNAPSAETFYRSRVKIVVTLILLVVFVAAAAWLLFNRGFDSWNPVAVYYFWVIPGAFFLKMWKGK